MELLRFMTCGNVDDGKSTLIGRLLHDSKSIMEDQLQAVREASTRRGHETVNLALLTDGLKAEREQGITIDVAYRYFSTPRRKFIIADCPGHIQYTRNMVTGASNVNLAILLVDARNGLVEQTRRHSFVASLLKIPHLVVCINKMDLVSYSEARFEEIRRDFEQFSKKLEVHDVTFIPVSALDGDNVVDPSKNMPWYTGRSLLNHLEEVHIASDMNLIDFRFPIQTVIFPQSKEHPDYRAYGGMLASGGIRVGDEVMALPSGFKSRVKGLGVGQDQLTEANVPLSVSIELEDDIDLCRGDILVRPNNQPLSGQDIEASVCWLGTDSFVPGKKYLLRHLTTEATALVKEITYKFDINSLSRLSDDKKIGLNDFARMKIRTSRPLFYDPYRVNRSTGSFILVDEHTGATVAAGMMI